MRKNILKSHICKPVGIVLSPTSYWDWPFCTVHEYENPFYWAKKDFRESQTFKYMWDARFLTYFEVVGHRINYDLISYHYSKDLSNFTCYGVKPIYIYIIMNVCMVCDGYIFLPRYLYFGTYQLMELWFFRIAKKSICRTHLMDMDLFREFWISDWNKSKF